MASKKYSKNISIDSTQVSNERTNSFKNITCDQNTFLVLYVDNTEENNDNDSLHSSSIKIKMFNKIISNISNVLDKYMSSVGSDVMETSALP